MKRLYTTLFLMCLFFLTPAQTVTLDGYVFEEYNRGFLNEVKITVLEKSGVLVGNAQTDLDGHFTFPIQANKEYFLQYEKKVFVTVNDTISTMGKTEGGKVFIKRQMERQPGYLLEVTLAEKRTSDEIPVDAVNGSRIEIYNLTTKKEDLVIESSESPVFSHTLQQGNHYIIMVRKKDFYAKRLEARVNVEGCYLCMEGFGTVTPGVMDNLTAAKGNALGTLLANVELERIQTGKNIQLQNIYYGYNSAELTESAKKELDKVTAVLQSNPSLIVELGSHTDSRGANDVNLKLSQARAQSAVDYILSSNIVDKSRLKARGYGESQLVNDCKDNKPCSETQHLQNRRTELKIIGFGNDPNEGLSLAQIISREQSLKMLQDGEFDKEYKVNDNGQVEAVKTPQPYPEQSSTINAYKPPVKPEAQVTRSDDFEGKKIEETKQKTVNFENPTAKTVQKPTPSVTEKKINTPLPSETRPAVDISKEIGGDIKVRLAAVGNYSGYKIEVFVTDKALSADDPDLKMIALDVTSDIAYENIKNGVSYLVGNIQSYSEAEGFLQKVAAKYPQARMIEYFNGKRIGD
jgi:outer membrane protein OmpA-like peptidoglycan-associated protein